jgi:hypothetical protein
MAAAATEIPLCGSQHWSGPRHADRIMRDYGREGDDALVLVARY